MGNGASVLATWTETSRDHYCKYIQILAIFHCTNFVSYRNASVQYFLFRLFCNTQWLAKNRLNSASADYVDSDYTDHLTGQSSMVNSATEHTIGNATIQWVSGIFFQKIPLLNQTQIIHILAATHWDLMEAKNESYSKLYNDHMKEKC